MEPVPVVWDGPREDWGRFDACILRSVSDYPDKLEKFVAWTRRVGAVIPFWNPPDLAIANLDKTYLRNLAKVGVPVLPTYWLEHGSDIGLDEVLHRKGWVDVVLKPTVDVGAKHLHRVLRGQSRGQELLRRMVARHGVMIQPFLPSIQEYGETSLVYVDSQLTHVVRKRPRPGDFRVQGSWDGTVEAAEASAAELDVARGALASLREQPLYARVDLVLGPDRTPCVTELELVEPILYFEQNPEAARLLADAIANRLRSA